MTPCVGCQTIRRMNKLTTAAVAIALLLATAVPAGARRVRGSCSNAVTGYLHSFTFTGRFTAAGSTGQLRGQVTGAGRCPHGRLRASCTKNNNFYDCQGTVGHCELDGPYYGSFPGTYHCANGTVGAFGWD